VRALARFLAERSVVEMGAAFAIGYGLFQLYHQVSATFLQAILPRRNFDSYTVHLGRHDVYLGNILVELVALGLLLATALILVRKLRLTT
jgi:hypothetical protein